MNWTKINEEKMNTDEDHPTVMDSKCHSFLYQFPTYTFLSISFQDQDGQVL